MEGLSQWALVFLALPSVKRSLGPMNLDYCSTCGRYENE